MEWNFLERLWNYHTLTSICVLGHVLDFVIAVKTVNKSANLLQDSGDDLHKHRPACLNVGIFFCRRWRGKNKTNKTKIAAFLCIYFVIFVELFRKTFMLKEQMNASSGTNSNPLKFLLGKESWKVFMYHWTLKESWWRILEVNLESFLMHRKLWQTFFWIIFWF